MVRRPEPVAGNGTAPTSWEPDPVVPEAGAGPRRRVGPCRNHRWHPVDGCDPRMGLLFRVELGHPGAALGRSLKFFGDSCL